MSLWTAVGAQLRHPRGAAGRATGHVMRLVNARPNALAVAALDVHPADDVLELGCGPGHALRLVAARARDGVVHAVDRSEAMLAQARLRNRAAVGSARVRLYCAAAERVPLARHSVDRVLAVNVAYFWDDATAALAEAHRVLRPGGRVAIYVTDAKTMRRWPFADAATHRLYDGRALAEALRDGGFAADRIVIRSVAVARGVTGLIATAAK